LRKSRPRRKVSIHAPAQGATLLLIVDMIHISLFQSTPPRRGRLTSSGLWISVTGFNPRPRAGGDTLRVFMLYITHGFNPRPRAGGDLA